ncbi:MAG: hypothetical protein GX136_03770 [Clostridiales bacterium]|nr:hypothetical protein [Clostridiales bacterium]
MKRFLVPVMATMFYIVVLLSGCDLVFPGADESDNESSSLGKKYLSEFENKWCYQRLNSDLKLGYGEIYTAVKDGFENDETVTISDSENDTRHDYIGLRIELSKPLRNQDDSKRLYTAFVSDNPQFFYIGNTYSYEGYRSGQTNYYNVFCLVYTMSARERAAASSNLEYTISKIMTKLYRAGPADQFEKELMLHDELVGICSYENKATQTDDPAALYPTAFTAYGALVEGRAVCEGYARAMQLLLHRAGIECTLVNGKDHNGVAHMWNMVTIDGRNYHLDPTWNDASDRIHHSYFNITTYEIRQFHTIDNDNIGIDTCTARDANYYIRKGRQLDTVRQDDIAKVIADAVLQGETMVDLRFTKDTFAGARLFINNRRLLIQKVNVFLKDAGITMWNYEDYNVNDMYYTLTIYKAEGQS